MPETRAEIVTLSNIANGAAVELFDHELKRVMANIKDPNADAKKKREVTLKVTLSPYADRSGAEMSLSVVSKTVPVNGVRGTIFVARDEGEYKAFSHDTRQEEMFAQEKAEREAAKAAATRNVVAMA